MRVTLNAQDKLPEPAAKRLQIQSDHNGRLGSAPYCSYELSSTDSLHIELQQCSQSFLGTSNLIHQGLLGKTRSDSIEADRRYIHFHFLADLHLLVYAPGINE